MTIGINAANLATEGLDLELAGGAIRITLGQSGGVTGRYEQDAGRSALRAIAAHQLSIRALSLPLAQGTLRVDAPSILSQLFVDAELGGGRSLVGRMTMASADAHVLYERGALVARAELSLAGVVYEQGGLAGQRAEIGSLEVGSLRVELQGAAIIQAGRCRYAATRHAPSRSSSSRTGAPFSYIESSSRRDSICGGTRCAGPS
jgi:hypothetical protein